MPGEARKCEVGAQVKQTAIGVIVATAGHDQRLDRDPVARLHMADPFADCLYDAAEFMTKDLWPMGAGKGMRLFRDEDRPIGVFMQIGPADAAETVLHQHLARPGLRRGLDIVNT